MLIVNISGMMQSVAGTKQPSLASLAIDIYNKPLQLLSTTFSCEIFELKDSTCYV